MKSIYDDKNIDKIAYSYILFIALFFSIYVFAKPIVEKYTNDVLLKFIALLGLICVVQFSLNRDYFRSYFADI